MTDVNGFTVSTPIKDDELSKKRERELSSSSHNASASASNPEKKNRQGSISEDNVSIIENPSSVHLAESAFERMATILKGAIKSDVETMVKSIVIVVTKSLTTRIDTLEKDNKDLRNEV